MELSALTPTAGLDVPFQPIRTAIKRADVDRANNAYARAVEMLYDLKALPRALGLFNEALAIRPKISAWYVSRSMCNRALGRYQHAFFDANAAVRLEPRNHSNYAARGLVLRKLGRYQDALGDFNTALQLHHKQLQDLLAGRAPSGASTGKTRAQQEAEAASAAAAARAAQEASGGVVGGYRYFRGCVLMDMEEFKAATDDFSAAVTAAGVYAGGAAPGSLGATSASALSGATGAASSASSSATDLSGLGVRARQKRAVCYQRCGRLAEALSDLRAVVRQDPGNPEAHAALGVFLCGIGRHAEARDFFTAAIDTGNAAAVAAASAAGLTSAAAASFVASLTYRYHAMRSEAAYETGAYRDALTDADESVKALQQAIKAALPNPPMVGGAGGGGGGRLGGPGVYREAVSGSSILSEALATSAPAAPTLTALLLDPVPYLRRGAAHLALAAMAAAGLPGGGVAVPSSAAAAADPAAAAAALAAASCTGPALPDLLHAARILEIVAKREAKREASKAVDALASAAAASAAAAAAGGATGRRGRRRSSAGGGSTAALITAATAAGASASTTSAGLLIYTPPAATSAASAAAASPVFAGPAATLAPAMADVFSLPIAPELASQTGDPFPPTAVGELAGAHSTGGVGANAATAASQASAALAAQMSLPQNPAQLPGGSIYTTFMAPPGLTPGSINGALALNPQAAAVAAAAAAAAESSVAAAVPPSGRRGSFGGRRGSFGRGYGDLSAGGSASGAALAATYPGFKVLAEAFDPHTVLEYAVGIRTGSPPTPDDTAAVMGASAAFAAAVATNGPGANGGLPRGAGGAGPALPGYLALGPGSSTMLALLASSPGADEELTRERETVPSVEDELRAVFTFLASDRVGRARRNQARLGAAAAALEDTLGSGGGGGDGTSSPRRRGGGSPTRRRAGGGGSSSSPVRGGGGMASPPGSPRSPRADGAGGEGFALTLPAAGTAPAAAGAGEDGGAGGGNAPPVKAAAPRGVRIGPVYPPTPPSALTGRPPGSEPPPPGFGFEWSAQLWPSAHPPFTMPRTQASATLAARIHFFIGLAYQGLRHRRRALYHFSNASIAWPAHPAPRYHVALMQHLLGEQGEAITTATTLLDTVKGFGGVLQVFPPGLSLPGFTDVLAGTDAAAVAARQASSVMEAKAAPAPAPAPASAAALLVASSPAGSRGGSRPGTSNHGRRRNSGARPLSASSSASPSRRASIDAAAVMASLSGGGSLGPSEGEGGGALLTEAQRLALAVANNTRASNAVWSPALTRATVVRLGLCHVLTSLPRMPPPVPPAAAAAEAEAAEAAAAAAAAAPPPSADAPAPAPAAAASSGTPSSGTAAFMSTPVASIVPAVTASGGGGGLEAASLKPLFDPTPSDAVVAATRTARAAVLLLRGLAKQALCQHVDAVRDFNAAAEADGDAVPRIFLHRAVSLLSLSRAKAAVTDCQTAAEKGCGAAVVHDKMAQAYSYIGAYREAVGEYTRSMEAAGAPAGVAGGGAAAAAAGAAPLVLPTLPPLTARDAVVLLSRRAVAQRGLGRLDYALHDLNVAISVAAPVPAPAPLSRGAPPPTAPPAPLGTVGVLTPVMADLFAGLLCQRAAVKAEKNDFTAAVDDYETALRMSSAPAAASGGVSLPPLDPEATAEIHYRIGVCHANAEAFDSAVLHFSQALDVLESLHPVPRLQLAVYDALPALEATAFKRVAAAQTGSPFVRRSAIDAEGYAAYVSERHRAARLEAALRTIRSLEESGAAAAAGSPTKGRGGNSPGSTGAGGSPLRRAASNKTLLSSPAPTAPAAQEAPAPEADPADPATQDVSAKRRAVAEALCEAARAANASASAQATRKALGAGVFWKVAKLRVAALHERAKAAQMLGQHGDAIADFTTVLAFSPTAINALFRRAFSYKALGRVEAAADDLEAARACAPPGDTRYEVNYAALDGVKVVVLVAAGEEPPQSILGAEPPDPDEEAFLAAAGESIVPSEAGTAVGHDVGGLRALDALML